MFLKYLSQDNSFGTRNFSIFEDILNDGLNLRVKVTGRSMAPFLKGGEILTIKKVPCHLLHRGDLIFFKNRYNSHTIHRIIKKRLAKNGMTIFQTKGDALIAFDAPVHETEVIGKVCRIDKIASNDKSKIINMESDILKKWNYLIAFTGLVKSKVYSGIFRFYKCQ